MSYYKITSVDKTKPLGYLIQDYANMHYNNGFYCGFMLGFGIGVFCMLMIK